MTRGRFVAGDPLRAWAAMTVVAYHVWISVVFHEDRSGFRDAYGPVLGRLVRDSAVVVFIFFVLSGYLLGRSFVRAIIFDRPLPRLPDYARNRVLRLLPVFWVIAALHFVIAGTYGSSAGEVAAIFLLVQNIVMSPAQESMVHTWTVDVETAFYVLLPLVTVGVMGLVRGRGTPRSRLLLVLGGLALVSLLSLVWRTMHATDEVWHNALPTFLFAFSVGIALAALETHAEHLAARVRRPRALGNAVCVSGVLILLAAGGIADRTSILRTLLLGAGLAGIVGGPLLRQWGGGGCSRVFDHGAAHAIGRWSYSVYLVHVPLMAFVNPRLHVDGVWSRVAVLGAITLLGSVALGALFFRFVERPCMRWRGASSQPVETAAASPAAAATADMLPAP